MLTWGTQVHVDGRVRVAIRIMQEVVRIEPKAISARAVLANCQADIGLHEADRIIAAPGS